ncbi:MAG TPA: glycosyltransferase family 1 protein [Gammaproteobacteria bacterium]|nr:glycosyltransferase family 1 protein [Gammaproteobacteria bacterium]
MAQKKIAIIRPFGHVIDLSTYNCQEVGLARGLASHGVDVDVFLAGEEKSVTSQTITEDAPGRVRVFRLPFFTLPEIAHAIYPSLRKLLLQGDYDLLHVNEENELTSFLVARLGAKTGIPVIIYQGMYVPITGRIRALFQQFYNIFFLPTLKRNISLAVAKTTTAEKYLQGKGFPRTAVVPVGLDPSPFSGAPDIDWHERLDIDPESSIILYVGVFEERRNIDFLLDLAKRFVGTGMTFVFVGTGPKFRDIQERIFSENITNTILPGRIGQRELPSLYRRSSLFLLASDYEIYGMVVLEAMYFGVPVLSTKTAGPLDIIRSREDGILFDDLSLEKWTRAINEIIENPATLQEMKNRAEQKIHDRLVWNAVAEKYINSIA